MEKYIRNVKLTYFEPVFSFKSMLSSILQEIPQNIGTQLVKHTPENVLHVSVTITEIGTFKLLLKSSFWFQTIHDFYTLNSGYLIDLFLVIISNVQSLKNEWNMSWLSIANKLLLNMKLLSNFIITRGECNKIYVMIR